MGKTWEQHRNLWVLIVSSSLWLGNSLGKCQCLHTFIPSANIVSSDQSIFSWTQANRDPMTSCGEESCSSGQGVASLCLSWTNHTLPPFDISSYYTGIGGKMHAPTPFYCLYSGSLPTSGVSLLFWTLSCSFMGVSPLWWPLLPHTYSRTAKDTDSTWGYQSPRAMTLTPRICPSVQTGLKLAALEEPFKPCCSSCTKPQVSLSAAHAAVWCGKSWTPVKWTAA